MKTFKTFLYEESKLNKAAGVILYNEDTGYFGLGLRGVDSDHPGVYGSIGGGHEPGETDLQCICRELDEELVGLGDWGMKFTHLDTTVSPNLTYELYLGELFSDVLPNPSNEENQHILWFKWENLPKNIHPGLQKSLEKLEVLAKLPIKKE